MSVKILIALSNSEQDFAERLIKEIKIIENSVEITNANNNESLISNLEGARFNILIIDSSRFSNNFNFKKCEFIALINEPGVSFINKLSQEDAEKAKEINKAQRISQIAREIWLAYSNISQNSGTSSAEYSTEISVFYSPAGGVGKTACSVAYSVYASSNKNNNNNKRIFYLNLEDFASTPIYFAAERRASSISTVIENLGVIDEQMNVKIAKIEDSQSKIAYFSKPENYIDMNALCENAENNLELNMRNLINKYDSDDETNFEELINKIKANDEQDGIIFEEDCLKLAGYSESLIKCYKQDNYLNMLINALLRANICDEIVIDLSCAINEKSISIFENATRIFLVSDTSETARIKIKQFMSQNYVYENIKNKIVLINNKGSQEDFNIAKNFMLPDFGNGVESRSLSLRLAEKIREKEAAFKKNG